MARTPLYKDDDRLALLREIHAKSQDIEDAARLGVTPFGVRNAAVRYGIERKNKRRKKALDSAGASK